MKLQPYLFFDGRAEEAAAFYRDALGAEVEMMVRFSDSPEPPDPSRVAPGSENKVMHMTLRIGDAALLGSDGDCHGRPSFEGFSLSLEVASDVDAERVFAALADGGKVGQELISTFFSSRFGTVTDRFGVPWMLTVARAQPNA
jgi:PhnB protein